mgnify:CR=1 FL=1
MKKGDIAHNAGMRPAVNVEKYDVMGVPALRLFVQGEVKAERAGAAGKADIEAWIDENLK